jgi:phosphohistidine swiveling domain-containing protein
VQKLRGVGVVAGVAGGPAVLQGGENATAAGAILLVNDGRTEMCPHVYDAKGIVLLSGGLVSPVARLAQELGVPVVHCPAARAFATRDIMIDGGVGTVVVRR